MILQSTIPRLSRYGWLLVFLCYHLYASPSKEIQTPVTLSFIDVPLVRVLQALADYQHLNLMVGEEVKGNVSVSLVNVPWEQALQGMAKMSALAVERQGNILFVQTASAAEARQQRLQQQRQQEKEHDWVSLHIPLQQAEVSEVEKNLSQQKNGLLSSAGLVVADTRTNTLFIRDIASNMPAIQAWVAEWDRPIAQIQLTAYIVTINRESLHELSVRWGLLSSSELSRSNNVGLDRFNVGLSQQGNSFSAGFHIARIDGRLLEMELTALEQEEDLEIIASPHLMTTNLQAASIKQGTEIPYEVSSGANGATAVEFKEAVLGMEVTPKLLGNGQIMLILQISQNVPGRTIKQGEGEALAIDKQEIKTQVTLMDGETAVLGGIFQQQKIRSHSQVPGLGDIPLLGGLFRDKSESYQRRELVIFITPTLLKRNKCHHKESAERPLC